MTFAEKLQFLCVERGIYANSVCQKLGFSRGAFTYWKKSCKTPNDAQLQKFADEFQITLEELVSGVDGIPKRNGGTIGGAEFAPTVGLSKQEDEIITLYRSLGIKKQLKFLQALVQISEED